MGITHMTGFFQATVEIINGKRAEMRLLIIFCLMVFSSPAMACVNPVGTAGEIIMNDAHSVPQYCDGTNWIAMTSGDNSPTCPAGLTACGGKRGEYVAFVIDGGASDASVAANDTVCQNTATSNGLFGTYKSWLADGTTASAPASRFNIVGTNYPIKLVTGDVVADNWSDLTDGTLDNSIGRTVTGSNTVIIQTVGTNVNIDGTRTSATVHCFAGGTGNISAGHRGFTNSGWTANVASYACGAGRSLYCFEQDSLNQTQVVPTGLLGHWRLDETAGTMAADTSGGGFSGTMLNGLTGSNSAGGVVGNTLDFDGTDDRINIGDVLDLGTNFSLSAWINADNPSLPGQRIIIKEDGVTGWALSISDQVAVMNGVRFVHRELSAAQTSTPTNIIFPGQWHHIAVTRSTVDNSVRIYVDGIERAVATRTGNLNDSSHSLGIGYNGTGTSPAGSRHFGGMIDDVRVYNRALTAPEVQEIFEARSGIRFNGTQKTMEYFDGNRHVSMTRKWSDITSGLVAHWKLDEVTGTSAADSSGNGNNGTMTGGISGQTNNVLGSVGSGLRFDGIDDYINISTNAVFDVSAMTVSGWVKLERLPSVAGSDSPLLYADSAGSGWAYKIQVDNSADRINFSGSDAGGTDFYVESDQPTVVGQWYHVVGTRDSSNNLRLYVNGVLQVDVVNSGTRRAADRPLQIGQSGADHAFATIDDIRIYNRDLSVAEIQTLYNMGARVGDSTALPQGCPNVGNVCDDGTVYAGLSPDGNVEMFTTIADAGNFPWNNGNSSGYTNAGFRGVVNTGASNTAGLMSVDSDSVTPGIQPHLAAKHCFELVAHGSSDWYLPATNELGILYDNRDSIGGFDMGPVWYYAATEVTADNGARAIRFMDGNYGGNADKAVSRPVRCVRKGPAPRCANPYGMAGQLLFNDAHDVVQYCDGARWIAIGNQ